MSNASTRLKEARERSQRTPDEVAESAGVSLAAYYDMEGDPEDFRLCPSIAEIVRIATAIGVDPFWLVRGTKNPALIRISLDDFVKHVESVSRRTGRSVEDLEQEAGYRIYSALVNPREILEWNLDYLEAVCGVINIELGSILHKNVLGSG